MRLNYACLDARVLSNTSAIIIETIEKTKPDGSIIRQLRGGRQGGGGKLDPDAPLPGRTRKGTFPGVSWSPPVLMCGNRRWWIGRQSRHLRMVLTWWIRPTSPARGLPADATGDGFCLGDGFTGSSH